MRVSWHGVASGLVALLLAGCARAVGPGGDAAVLPDAIACGAPLTCWTRSGTIVLPTPKACASDGDCVVREFPSDSSGTREIAALAASGVAAFDRAVTACTNTGGVAPGPTFYEDDSGVVAPGSRSATNAVCRGGCCVAEPTAGVDCDSREVRCNMVPSPCPRGEIHAVHGACWGPCVQNSACTPIVCSGDTDCPADFRCAGMPGERACVPATD